MEPTADIKHMRDVLMSRVDEQLAHIYEQIKKADEQLARAENQLSGLGREETPRWHARRSRNRPWLRGIVGLLLASFIVAAAFLSQSSYGGVVGRSMPQLVSTLVFPKLIAQLAAAEPPAQTKPNDRLPTTLKVFSERATSLETMTLDLADLKRKIEMLNAMVTDNANSVEQIKANQEQVARDIAKNAELLKASQEQVEKLVATASQQNLSPRTSSPQPQAPLGARKPVPTPASPHASARTQAPMRLEDR